MRAYLVAMSLLAGCGSSAATAEWDPVESDAGQPPVPAASNCVERCSSMANLCGVSASQCDALCGTLTEAQLACVESAGRDDKAARRCVQTSTSKPDAGTTVVDSGTTTTKPDEKPSQVTITGHFGQVKATHTLSGDKKVLVSALSMAPKPTFVPEMKGELPLVSSAKTKTIDSPAIGSCKVKSSLILNSSQIGLIMDASDVLPASECATFFDDVVAKGITLTLTDVPYNGGDGAASKVTIKLTP